MVHFVHLFSAAALLTVSSAAPMVARGDSAIGSEVPVSAPNGTPMSDSVTASTAGGSPNGAAWMPPPQPSPQGGYQNGWNSPPVASPSSPVMVDATSSAAWSSPTMASATLSSPMPQMTYGSGSNSWGGNGGYNSCVQQCAASFGQPAGTWTASPTQASASAGVAGTNGVTHTVIVAPSQGVLRYIPFSTNASVGDTVTFQWHAGPHTVTQSSALEVCNKTNAPGAFASGQQNASFVFNQVVNDTNPIWFYCGVPNHCEKGMFGGINIGQADPTGNVSSSNTSSYMPLSSMMANLTMSNQDMGAMWSYTKTKTVGNSYADTWGMSTNCAGMNQDAMMQTAQNVMYMQVLIAANPAAVKNGVFSVSNTPNMSIPMDITQLSNASPSGANAGASATGGATSVGAAGAASSVAPSSSASPTTNGAGSVTSSSIAVGLAAIMATLFTL